MTMTGQDMDTLGKAIGATLATETSALIDRRLDARVEVLTAFLREFVDARLPPADVVDLGAKRRAR
jgi:hypothetical protein